MKLLFYYEKYQNAIIGTLLIHVLIFVWLNVQSVSFYVIQPKEKTIANAQIREAKIVKEIINEHGDVLSDITIPAKSEKIVYARFSLPKSIAIDNKIAGQHKNYDTKLKLRLDGILKLHAKTKYLKKNDNTYFKDSFLTDHSVEDARIFEYTATE